MTYRKIKSALGSIYYSVFRFYKEHYRFKLDSFNEVSKRYNRCKYFCALHYILCSYIYGCDLSEYFIYEFFKLNYAERRLFVTRRSKFKIYKKFNNNEFSHDIFNDKSRFNEKFESLLGRKYLFCPNATIDEIIGFILNLGRIIVKPTSLKGGEGIFIKSVSEINDIRLFAINLKRKSLLIEEVLTQEKVLANLNIDSINTIRSLCVLDHDGKIHLISAALRVGRKGSIVDNISAGGVLYPLDIKRGYVNGVGIDGAGSLHTIHPGTTYYMPGYKIPKWEEVIDTIEKAMRIIPVAKLVAWDICISSTGIAIVEGNLMPNPRTFQMDKIGKKFVLKDLIK